MVYNENLLLAGQSACRLDLGEVNTWRLFISNVGVNFLYDGIFKVNVASVFGDFYIVKSDLTIDYKPCSRAHHDAAAGPRVGWPCRFWPEEI